MIEPLFPARGARPALYSSRHHVWLEALPLGSGYVCEDCGQRVRTAAEMSAGTCRAKLVPEGSGWEIRPGTSE